MLNFTFLDRALIEVDTARRTLLGLVESDRPSPADKDHDKQIASEPISLKDKKEIAALMRINHCGEVCAQALYQGQAFTANNKVIRDLLNRAAEEEKDHLVWCEQRIKQLDDSVSVLNPLFYGLSFSLGTVFGLMDDRKNLGFVEATEAQVCQHLQEHLDRIPETDWQSKAILQQMLEDEEKHGAEAIQAGGQAYSKPTKMVMSLLAKVMTETTYHI